MPNAPQTADNDLLRPACELLGLVEGCLLSASNTPTDGNQAEWVDKGDWLKLAHSLDAEQVFFVEGEPVLVTARLPEGEDEGHYFNRIWCMARPQVLFLAREGELAVYKLSAPPVRGDEPVRSEARLLALAGTVADITEKLADFSRESIESGNLFGEERFGTGSYRADRALVHDLKLVRQQLTTGDDPLSDEVAHSLIGRALFVRYLEDRQILVPDYFDTIARDNPSWEKLLENETEVFAEPHHAALRFFRVLKNREFTYAFFKQLAADFNGDTFVVTAKEQREVKSRHLKLLRDLLTGSLDTCGQEQLFLFAYRFEVIPIELISSIYEDFYTAQRGKGNTQSSYYTPPALADFLLSRVLTTAVLEQRPRITDPACGSGIFLVESFRRIVRYRMAKQGRRLRQSELRVILRDQIRGMDLNPEAVPVAAFSLYLAYLHYQEPREVNETRRLPNLRWKPEQEDRDPDQHFDILFAGSAFDAITSEAPIVREHFGPASADIVVGNPPWGEVKPKDTLGQAAKPAMNRWLETDDSRITGDGELSQAFVHLALELLADGGKAALLLSSGVLFKQHENSRAFRQSWLRRCKLEHMVNFAHVRHIFFADPVRPGRRKSGLREGDGASPFISAVFEKGAPSQDHRFTFWSARRTAEIENTRAIIVSRADMHRLRQDDCRRYENLWKLYWWGNRRDEGLIRDLERFDPIGRIVEKSAPHLPPAQGFTPGSVWDTPNFLKKLQVLPTTALRRYGDIPNDAFEPAPATVEYRPRDLYPFEGARLLVRRGITTEEQGRIVSRLEHRPFGFTNSITSIRLDGLSHNEQLAILGITWSKLALYYFWLTAGSWGMWHDEIQKYVACSLPISIREHSDRLVNVMRIVTSLQTAEPPPTSELPGTDAAVQQQAAQRLARISQMEAELDEAVFDLYELNEAERDLVRDMCRYGLDFFYKRGASISVQPVAMPALTHGLACDLPEERSEGLTGYLQVFLAHWNPDLEPEGELAWEVIEGPARSAVLAVVFTSTLRQKRPKSARQFAPKRWADILKRISQNSLVPVGTRKAIYTDPYIRAVSKNEILIIKRNEARHWTRSMAREDADATINRAIHLADRQS